MLIIIIVMMVDLMSFSLVLPVLPVIQTYFNISTSQAGYLIQIYAFFMMIGSIFFGILSDKIGRKYTLAIPVFGSAITYYLTIISPNFFIFLLCRALNGFFSGSFAVGFAAASDLSTPENRLKNMSTLAACYALSFMIGSILGGLVTNFTKGSLATINAPLYLACVLSFISSILVLVFFKESFPKKQRNKHSNFIKVIISFFKILFNKQVLFISLLNIACTSFIASLQVYLSLWLYHTFNFNPNKIGYVWAFNSIFAILTQIIIGRYLSNKNPKYIILYGFLLVSLGYFILFTSHSNIYIVFIALICLFIGIPSLVTSINTKISLNNFNNQQGTLFGINQSISGLGRSIGPIYVGLLITYISYNSTWLVLSISSLILFLLALKFLSNRNI